MLKRSHDGCSNNTEEACHLKQHGVGGHWVQWLGFEVQIKMCMQILYLVIPNSVLLLVKFATKVLA